MMTTLFVGLGNPGAYYEHTRHNLGFVAVDAIGDIFHVHSFHRDEKLHADVAEVATERGKLVLAKPQTFMNESGTATKKLLAYYKVGADDLWVLHDDVDLLPGDLRHTFGSRSAGHRGVQSIIDTLGTQSFHRLRIGVGSGRAFDQPTDRFVLAEPTDEEKEKLSMRNLLPRMQAILSEYVPAFVPEQHGDDIA